MDRALLKPSPLHDPRGTQIVALNRAVVEREFSLARYGMRLRELYTTVMGSAPSAVGAHDAGQVRRFFLDPARLFLLRSS